MVLVVGEADNKLQVQEDIVHSAKVEAWALVGQQQLVVVEGNKHQAKRRDKDNRNEQKLDAIIGLVSRSFNK